MGKPHLDLGADLDDPEAVAHALRAVAAVRPKPRGKAR
jgi:hypothetical protein